MQCAAGGPTNAGESKEELLRRNDSEVWRPRNGEPADTVVLVRWERMIDPLQTLRQTSCCPRGRQARTIFANKTTNLIKIGERFPRAILLDTLAAAIPSNESYEQAFASVGNYDARNSVYTV